MLRNLLLLTCLWGVMTVSVDAAVIRLRDKVSVDAALISLGDIANLSEVADAEREQLQRLTLAPAPAAGRTTTISLDTIRRELSLRGIDQTNLQFSGPSQTEISRVSHVSPREPRVTVSDRDQRELEKRLEQNIQQAITQIAAVEAGIRVSFVESQIRDLLTAGQQSLNWQVDASTIQRFGPQVLQFRAVDSQGQTVTRNLRVVLSEAPRVLALKRDLPRGKVIRADDLKWIESEQVAGLFVDPQEVIGTETVRGVRADSPLQRDEVRQLPLVRRNEIVSVSANIGSISVRRYCRSLGEASLGQFVTLVPVDGKDKITARVTGLREAEVLLDDAELPGASRETTSQKLILSSSAASSKQGIRSTESPMPTRQPLAGQLKNPVLAQKIQPAGFETTETRPLPGVVQQPAERPELEQPSPQAEPVIPWSQPGRILPNQPAILTE